MTKKEKYLVDVKKSAIYLSVMNKIDRNLSLGERFSEDIAKIDLSIMTDEFEYIDGSSKNKPTKITHAISYIDTPISEMADRWKWSEDEVINLIESLVISGDVIVHTFQDNGEDVEDLIILKTSR